MDMNLLTLIFAMSSVLFALLQYKSDKSNVLFKKMISVLKEHEISTCEKERLDPYVKESLYFLTARMYKPMGIRKGLLLSFASNFCLFSLYLVLIASFRVLDVMDVDVLDVMDVLWSKNSQGIDYMIIDTCILSVGTFIFSLSMFALICASCYQIFWGLSKDEGIYYEVDAFFRAHPVKNISDDV